MVVWQDWRQSAAVLSQGLYRMVVRGGQSKATLIGINVLLVLWLSYSLAGLTWRLLPTVEQQPLPAPVAAVAPQRQQPALNIARWHLFGEPASTGQEPVRAEDIPETRLQLILRGVISGDNGSVSGAIIAEPSGRQAFYAVGADLPGGAVLKEVHDWHIVLLRNGHLETLRLPRDNLDTPVADDDQAAETNLRPGGQPLMSLSEYRDTLLENPQQLADVVQARPYHRDGVNGYQISPGRDAALFTQLGLQPNDVITEVNGISLDNPARGLNVLQTLREQSQVTIVVVRGGIPQTMTVDINQ